MKQPSRISDSRLSELVKISRSVSDVLRRAGYRAPSGGTHSYLSRRIKRCGIDTSHFIGSLEALRIFGKGGLRLKPEQILVTKNRREHAHRLRRALIESGVKYECSLCGIPPEWNNLSLMLEVDHKNNDPTDHRIENVRFLCPNCHSQRRHKMNKGLSDVTTVTTLKKKEERQSKKEVSTIKTQKKKRECVKCFAVISRRSEYCKRCSPRKTKIDWPPLSVLMDAKKNRKIWALAQSLGVSDVAIHKRISRNL